MHELRFFTFSFFLSFTSSSPVIAFLVRRQYVRTYSPSRAGYSSWTIVSDEHSLTTIEMLLLNLFIFLLTIFSESELHRKFCRHLVLVSYINVRLAGARVSCCCQSSRKGFKIWVLTHSSVLLSQISFIHTLTHEQKTKTLHRFFLHEAYGFISSRFFVGR
jgi:hypothetical protein